MGIPEVSPPVAMLDCDQLQRFEWSRRLAAEEVDESRRIANHRRREEWVAGRIAAKFVFLQRERSGVTCDGPHLQLQSITTPMLDAHPAEAYQEVVVIRDQSPGGGPARIGRRCDPRPVPVSVSHARRLACAFIGTSAVYALDIESPSPRVPEFYLYNFTARERGWTDECARRWGIDSNWSYTLLWSAKECLLKTAPFAAYSLWHLPLMEIRIPESAERLKTISQAAQFSPRLEILQGEIALAQCRPRQFQLAVGGGANLIVTVITELE